MSDNRETIEMLKVLKEQALKSHNDTAVLEVKIDSFNFVLDKAIQALEQEPKTGRWIKQDGFDGDIYYDCSECGESFCLIDGTPTDNLYNHCPNCGTKMVEPKESEE